MPRGGYRQNAGRKPKWRSGKTKMIRVPIELADQLLEIADRLDQGVSIENESISNNIDFSSIPLIVVNGKKGVSLVELLKAGYEIYPLSLASSVRQEFFR